MMVETTDLDTTKLYLKDIDKAPLLTVDEEKALARRVKKGDARARRKMVQSNLRLVVNIAKRYSKYGVPFLDLVEEGNIGLMKAVNKYDPGTGYRFSTYASWWIKQAVLRALSEQGKTIRVPVYMSETISRYRKAVEKLKHLLRRSPRINEVARKLKTTVKKVKEIQLAMDTNPSSLETPIGENGAGKLLDLVEDISAENPLENITRLLQQERVKEVVDKLKPRYKRVLVLRFGLENKEPCTLEEIGQRLRISKERVRQIEDRAIEQLKEALVSKEQRQV